jgi:hypothetical protein
MFIARSAALVVALAVGLMVSAPATASAASTAAVFTHSATSGVLKGNRLTLKDVGGRVTWAAASGRAGAISVKRFHRGLFTPRTPSATAALHVAGHQGGDEPTFMLSRPRYSAARRTVSYRVKSLRNKPLPSTAARAAGIAPSGRFGAASLSIAGTVRDTGGDSQGDTCTTTIKNDTDYSLQATASTIQGSDDVWNTPPHGNPIATTVASRGSATWGSHSDNIQAGCSNGATWTIVGPFHDPVGVTFDFTTTITYAGFFGPDVWTNTCTPSSPRFSCELDKDAAGIAVWRIYPTTEGP